MAETKYRIDAYDTSGVKQAVITDFLWLAYGNWVNSPGILKFGLRADHDVMQSVADKWQFEVWRRLPGYDWYRDYVALYRQPEWTMTDIKRSALVCPGLKTLLSWRIVNWPAGTANRSKFTTAKAETVMKTLVDYNAGSSATTGNGRKRNGAITGLTVEADAAGGNTVDWYCAQDNLLKTLQELSDIAGGDFDLVKTSSTAWQFRWGVWNYVNGTLTKSSDRSASVIFSHDRGNMSNIRYFEKKIQEATVAAVWGKGEGSTRDYVTRTGANYSASNDIEMYVDAKNVDLGDTAGLNSRGDQKLAEVQASTEFSFSAVQSPTALYGQHYFLGDLVSALNPFTAASITLQVDSVSISVDGDGRETVEPKFVEA